jgi:hypothetical protein
LTRKLCEKNDKIFYTHAQLFFHFPAWYHIHCDMHKTKKWRRIILINLFSLFFVRVWGRQRLKGKLERTNYSIEFAVCCVCVWIFFVSLCNFPVSFA